MIIEELVIKTADGEHTCVAMDARKTWYGLGYGKTDNDHMLTFNEKISIGPEAKSIMETRPQFVMIFKNPIDLIGIRDEINRILETNGL